MKRQSLLLTGPKQLQWITESMPELQPDEIWVRTRTGAISLGTELQYYRGEHRGSHPISYPIMTGYESVGRVVACGTHIKRISIGDRVLAFYGHRTHATLKESNAIHIPANISDALALLAILACDTAKGIAKTKLKLTDTVLITGAGTIGLLTLFNLKIQGIKAIDVVEPVAFRRKLARQLGASTVSSPLEAAGLSNEYQVGFECSGRNQAFNLLQKHLMSNGQICILSDGNIEPLTLSPHFHEKELNVVGSSDGENYSDYANWFFAQVPQFHEPLASLYQQKIKADQLAACFAEIAQSNQPPLKVLIHYGPNPA